MIARNVQGSLTIDTEKMHELIGPTRTDWRDGILSQIRHMAPEVLLDGR